MFIHSSLYKKHFPFHNNAEIQQLDDHAREKLSKHIRDVPRMFKYWKLNAAMNAAKGHLGSRTCFDFSEKELEKLRPEIDALADKVVRRRGLTEDEVLWVNVALCAHKYNWPWNMYLHPTMEIVELTRKRTKQKGETHTCAEPPKAASSHWEFGNDYQSRCTNCNEISWVDHDEEHRFCPNCGAKMTIKNPS